MLNLDVATILENCITFGPAIAIAAIVCSIIRARWGYSRSDLYHMSPFGRRLRNWIGNPIGYFLGITVFVLFARSFWWSVVHHGTGQ
jgi:hypothetical protein